MDLLFSAHWKTFDEHPVIPNWLITWLNEPNSMTERVKSLCTHDFRVEVLRHELVENQQLRPELQLVQNELVLQREVLLCDGDTPLIFAYSLLPEIALNGLYAELRKLGSRPLGHWLFTEPVLKRYSVQTAALTTQETLFQKVRNITQLPPSIWGRKALFSGAAKPLLVSEFFLPHLQFRTE